MGLEVPMSRELIRKVIPDISCSTNCVVETD